MYQATKILAYIGARKGSKRLPNKNIKLFAGKPLIEWSIRQSLSSKFVDTTLVSTDSEEIAEVSQKIGAQVPFLRPDNLATDDSPAVSGILHAIEFLEEKETKFFDYVILLQPTQPLRPKHFIDDAIEFYFKRRKSSEDTLVTVKPVAIDTNLLMKESSDGYIHFIQSKDNFDKHSTEVNYLPTGLIYIAPIAALKKHKQFYTDKTLFLETPEKFCADIDTVEDFDNALKMREKLLLSELL